MNAINLNAVLQIGAVTLGFLATVATVLMSRSVKGLKARSLALETGLAATRRELEMMAAISLTTGRRIQSIERENARVADRVEQFEPRGRSQRSFDQAIDSARRGADPAKIAQQFGLSRGEADLVLRMHGRKKHA